MGFSELLNSGVRVCARVCANAGVCRAGRAQCAPRLERFGALCVPGRNQKIEKMQTDIVDHVCLRF